MNDWNIDLISFHTGSLSEILGQSKSDNKTKNSHSKNENWGDFHNNILFNLFKQIKLEREKKLKGLSSSRVNESQSDDSRSSYVNDAYHSALEKALDFINKRAHMAGDAFKERVYKSADMAAKIADYEAELPSKAFSTLMKLDILGGPNKDSKESSKSDKDKKGGLKVEAKAEVKSDHKSTAKKTEETSSKNHEDEKKSDSKTSTSTSENGAAQAKASGEISKTYTSKDGTKSVATSGGTTNSSTSVASDGSHLINNFLATSGLQNAFSH